MNDRLDHLFITVKDFESSIQFYRDVLGWSVSQSWGGKGADRGAVLSGGGIKMVIAEKPAREGLHPHVHLDIHDIDARFRDLPKGSHVIVPPSETHWGTRWFVVRDPDGNLIAFEELRPRNA